MKAYVIKNKEGKYWCGNNRFSATLDIRKIYFCEDFDFTSKVINKLSSEGLLTDCTIVPITICEGDLEEEIGILKGFAYKLFREKYDDIPEKKVKEWFDDALKDTRNFIQQAKEIK